MADMTVNLLGLTLKSPFVLGSGPLSFSADSMVKWMEAGMGAVVTKTIRTEKAVNPVPHIWKQNSNTLINAEKWADDPPEQWIEEYIPDATRRGAVVIASVGHTAEEVLRYVRPASRAGAALIEVVSYQEQEMLEMIRIARRDSAVPVLAKVSPNCADPVALAVACIDAGAHGITAIDSLGPTLKLDPATGRPVLGSPRGYGWTSGAAIKGLAMRIVADIAIARPGVPIVGTGGVMNGSDGLEMLMAGATALGICSAPIMFGPGVVDRILKQLEAAMGKVVPEPFAAVAQASGYALQFIAPLEEQVGLLQFSFKDETCTNCQACVTMCPYDARELVRPHMSLDRDLCVDCGYCVAACPTDALIATFGDTYYGKQPKVQVSREGA